MSSPVRLVFFTQTFGCETCGETKRLLDDLVTLNPLLSVSIVGAFLVVLALLAIRLLRSGYRLRH